MPMAVLPRTRNGMYESVSEASGRGVGEEWGQRSEEWAPVPECVCARERRVGCVHRKEMFGGLSRDPTSRLWRPTSNVLRAW